MGKWLDEPNLPADQISDDDKLLMADVSEAEGSRDKTILFGAVRQQLGAHTYRSISQVAHGFAVGDVVRHDGSGYVEATADTEDNAVIIGVVSSVTDVDSFSIVTAGFISGLSGLTAGTTYYLQDAGGIGDTAGTVEKPVLIAVSATEGFLLVVGAGSGSGDADAFSPDNQPRLRATQSTTFEYDITDSSNSYGLATSRKHVGVIVGAAPVTVGTVRIRGNTAAPNTTIMRLYTSDGTHDPLVLLASKQVEYTGSSDWIEYTFDEAVELAAGERYAFQLELVSGTDSFRRKHSGAVGVDMGGITYEDTYDQTGAVYANKFGIQIVTDAEVKDVIGPLDPEDDRILVVTEAERDALDTAGLESNETFIVQNSDAGGRLEYWNGTAWVSVNAAPTITAKTAAYTLQESDNGNIIEVDATSAAVTISLPDGLSDGFQAMIVKTDSSANAVTLAASGTATLVGKGTDLTAQHDVATVYRKSGDTYRATGDLS